MVREKAASKGEGAVGQIVDVLQCNCKLAARQRTYLIDETRKEVIEKYGYLSRTMKSQLPLYLLSRPQLKKKEMKKKGELQPKEGLD